MFERAMISNLLGSIDMETACRYSYRNYHTQGLTYINLLRTERLTVKLYLFDGCEHNSRGFLVWPHNHAYNFSHHTLVGKITNYTFNVVGGKDWNLYTFDTPLNDGQGLQKMIRCGLEGESGITYWPGGGYYLTSEQIHTISVHGDYAAALLVQYHDQDPGQLTTMYAPASVEPDCNLNLYERLAEWQAQRFINEFLERWNGEENG